MNETLQVVIVTAAAGGALLLLVRSYWPAPKQPPTGMSAGCPKCPSAPRARSTARQPQR